LMAMALIIVSILIEYSTVAIILVAFGAVAFMYQVFRTWVIQQVYLIMAALRNLWTKELIWSKNSVK
ncbi:glycosyltransferase family 2 protein, partial [Candidatus Bathyarchaeota archaeon]|nr:glycosyltransferase family 2 protein [Candidatus Bathyarchaeota archaeon]